MVEADGMILGMPPFFWAATWFTTVDDLTLVHLPPMGEMYSEFLPAVVHCIYILYQQKIPSMPYTCLIYPS